MSPRYLELTVTDEYSFLDDDDRPTRQEVSLTVAALAGLFVCGYCIPNAINSLRGAPPAWVGSWERHIPFSVWMIIPYASLDALFVLSPFCCRMRSELRTLFRRSAATFAIAATCFLLFPSRLCVPRPAPDGPVAKLLQPLLEIDGPNNVFPSLHVALVVILTSLYVRRSSGLMRWFVGLWFVLIAVSTLLTYQHYVIDALAGLVLGCCCRRWIPEEQAAAETAADDGPILLPFESRRTLPTQQIALGESRRAA